MLRSYLIILVCICLVIIPSQSEARQCRSLIKQVLKNYRTQSPEERHKEILVWKEKFSRPDYEFKKKDIENPNSLIAFLEVNSRRNIEDISYGKITSAQRKVIKIWKKFQKDKNSSNQYHKILEKLYFLLYMPKPKEIYSNRNLFLRFTRIQPIIRQRIEQEFVRSDVVTAMKNLGFIYEEGRLKRFIREHSSLYNSIILTAINAPFMIFALKSGFPFIPYLKKISWLNGKEVPKEILEKIRVHGFKAVYPEIRSQFKNSAMAALAYNRMAQVYVYLAMGFMGYYYMFKNFDKTQEIVRAFNAIYIQFDCLFERSKRRTEKRKKQKGKNAQYWAAEKEKDRRACFRERVAFDIVFPFIEWGDKFTQENNRAPNFEEAQDELRRIIERKSKTITSAEEATAWSIFSEEYYAKVKKNLETTNLDI